MSGPSYCPFAQRDMRQSKMQTELRKRVSRDRSVGSKSGFADHEDRPVILSICQSEVEVPFIEISCSAGVPPTRWITVSAGGAWATRDSSAAGEDARQTAAGTAALHGQAQLVRGRSDGYTDLVSQSYRGVLWTRPAHLPSGRLTR